MGLPQPQPRFSRAEYFEWEAQQPDKHEYLAGEVFPVHAMVGARRSHVLVCGALFARLREHLRGTRCQSYVSDMKLEVEAIDAVFYPDVMVSCDEADRQQELALHAPLLIVEVLSDSTAAYDRGDKFAAYRQLGSLQEYLLINIRSRRLELFRREPVGWVLHEPVGVGESAVLRLDSVALDLTLSDVFSDLEP